MAPEPDKYLARVESVRRSLLERAGGTWTTTTVAKHLDLSPEQVRERAHQDEILSLRSRNGTLVFPCIQFDSDGVVDGLERVLKAMHVQDPWMRLQLLMDDDVLGALMDARVNDAVSAADSYLPRKGPSPSES